MGTLKSVSNAAEDGGGILDAEFGRLLKAIDSEMRAASKGFYHELNPAESETYQALKKRPAKDQADLARYMFKNRQKAFTGREKVNGIWMGRTPRGVELFRGLMRANLPILPEELLSWVIDMKGDRDQSGPRRMLTPVRFSEWPIGWMIQQVERKAIKAPLSDEALRMLREIRAWPEMDEARGYYGTDFGKVKIENRCPPGRSRRRRLGNCALQETWRRRIR